MLNPGQYYHIYNHANAFDKFFKEERNYDYFLRKYAYYISPIAHTFAYCLIPNHFHFLVKIKEEEELRLLMKESEQDYSKFLSRQFSNFCNSYVKAYNKVYKRRGALFLHNFKRKPVLSDRQFLNTFLYIQLNPVKHGMIKDHFSWKWTSFHDHYSGEKPEWLESDEIFEIFGAKENYLRAHAERCKELLAAQDLDVLPDDEDDLE